MKKLIAIGIFMVAVFGFYTMTWADAETVFDDFQNWIIMAYTAGSGPYSVYIEVRDTSNILIPIGSLEGLTSNPEEVTTVATESEICLSFDNMTGTLISIIRIAVVTNSVHTTSLHQARIFL